MTQASNSTSIHKQISLTNRMLVGAGIGLSLILIYLIPVEPNPAWGKFWMVRPLIIVPLAGAMGGLSNYILVRFHELVGVNKTVAISVSVVVFIVGLWLGIVLGLDTTLWD
jgi:hypothetical protein